MGILTEEKMDKKGEYITNLSVHGLGIGGQEIGKEASLSSATRTLSAQVVHANLVNKPFGCFVCRVVGDFSFALVCES